MKQEILDRIDSLVAGYVNSYATDWTEIDRPLVEKLDDSNSFLVMMRPSGVDVAFFDGEYHTLDNAFRSQAALPNHAVFLYYDGQRGTMLSIARSSAQKLCDEAASRFENLDLPMDGFMKAVQRLSDFANKFENRDTATGICGPWTVSLHNRQMSTGMGLAVCFEGKPIVMAFKNVDPWGHVNLELGRYHNVISDKTFNEIFDSLHSEFPTLIRDFDERKRLQANNKDLGK